MTEGNLLLYYVVASPWSWVLEECIQRCGTRHTDCQNNPRARLDRYEMRQVSSLSQLPSSKTYKDGIPRRGRRRGACTLRIEIVVPENMDRQQYDNDISTTIPLKNQKQSPIRGAPDTDYKILLLSHGILSILDDLDDKDSLVRTIHKKKQANIRASNQQKKQLCLKSDDFYDFHPKSLLLDWDISSKEDCAKIIQPMFPYLCREFSTETEIMLTSSSSPSSSVAILKTPLGSRGEGVFFVSTFSEVYDLIQSHQQRAKQEPGFLDMLYCWKGRIPSWVLQEEIYPPMLIQNQQKFHLRTYIVVLEQCIEETNEQENVKRKPNVYIYNRHEVRIASKSMVDESAISTSNNPHHHQEMFRDRDAHITNGAGGDSTQRVLLQEVDKLISCNMQRRVEEFVAEIFLDHVMDSSTSSSLSSTDVTITSANTAYDQNMFSFAGVDIMVDEAGKLYLLEVNVNPAAPPQAAVIGTTFHEHLVGLMLDIITLLSTIASDPEESQDYNFRNAEDMLMAKKQ